MTRHDRRLLRCELVPDTQSALVDAWEEKSPLHAAVMTDVWRFHDPDPPVEAGGFIIPLDPMAEIVIRLMQAGFL